MEFSKASWAARNTSHLNSPAQFIDPRKTPHAVDMSYLEHKIVKPEELGDSFMTQDGAIRFPYANHVKKQVLPAHMQLRQLVENIDVAQSHGVLEVRIPDKQRPGKQVSPLGLSLQQ